MEKTSFAHLNKLFKMDVAKWAHSVLLSGKNLQVLIKNPKSFIIPMFTQLASPFLEPDELFMLNDLPFYEVARLEDFEARQAHLEE